MMAARCEAYVKEIVNGRVVMARAVPEASLDGRIERFCAQAQEVERVRSRQPRSDTVVYSYTDARGNVHALQLRLPSCF